MKQLFLFLLIFTGFQIQSQSIQLSDKAEISLITCGPGTELYAAFGHTAFRINDPELKIDRVYNYGTFDFNDPNFYPNFAKGNLEYFLSAYDFSRFIRTYHREKRWMKGQVLDLNQKDVQLIFEYLENNALPENRVYLYDYFFDNCSTKPYDVIQETIGNKLVEPHIFKENYTTHRKLIQPYLKNFSWGDFGIDLGLGSPIDRPVTEKEYLFLPENILLYFDALQINENGKTKPIIKRTEEILLDQNLTKEDTFFTPFVVFLLLAFFSFYITYSNIKRNKRSRIFDFCLFFITGLIGLFIVSVWFGTNHISSRDNYNILWAFPPNLIVSFFLLKKQLPKWVSKYALLNLLVLGMLVVFWALKIQVYSIAVFPILLLLGSRYLYLWKGTNN